MRQFTGGPMHCPLLTTPLQMPLVLRRFSRNHWGKKKEQHVSYFYCCWFFLLSSLRPRSSKFLPFFSNGFVQLHNKSHPPKRQSNFLCTSPWKLLLVVRASQPLFNVKLYGFGDFPNSINPPDGTDTLSGVVRTELINCSLLRYWTLSNETIMLSPGSGLCSV